MSEQGGKTARLSRFRGAVKSIIRDTRGSVLPMMAAAFIPTTAMIGGGIDFGRAYLANSKLQGAVDSAALAAVRAKQLSSNSTSAAETIGEDYMDANFPTGYLGAKLVEQKVTVTETDSIVKAEVKANGTIDTTLLRLIGMNSLSIRAEAVAEASDTLPNSVEALLVLDNTGSMAGSRMSALKTASKNFVGVIYGDKQSRDGFAVGILPYNTMVNVGRLVRSTNPSMLQERDGFTDISTSDPLGWKGCVFADRTIRNISEDPFTLDVGAFDLGKNMPGEDGMPKLEPFVYPPIYVDSFQDINNRYTIPDDRHDEFFEIPTVREALIRRFGNDICKEGSKGKGKGKGKKRSCDLSGAIIDFDQLPDRALYVKPRAYSHKSGVTPASSPNNLWGASPNYQCPAQALPLSYSATKSSLRSYIDNENEALLPGTGTFHNPAMTWAYRMMMREDVFPRSRPNNIPVKRVVIFMTDGNFDSRDDGRKDGGKTILDTAYTSYKTYEDKLITTSTSRADTVEHLSRRFAKTCEAMKNDGIEIYTIAFALNNNAEGNATREMFRECSTDRNTHFFSAANGNDLNEAFVTIASELVNLRLTK